MQQAEILAVIRFTGHKTPELPQHSTSDMKEEEVEEDGGTGCRQRRASRQFGIE